MALKDTLGAAGETVAARYLESLGYDIVDRNWRGTRGELDIVARHGGTTVFVEVKTRSGLGFGHPFEAITPRKLARLRRLAAEWCRATDAAAGAIRVDVVAVIGGLDGPARIEHLRGVS
ncbi:YraN family protein [Gryllotalpicola ginsengisoli]|uniref:YraN family protein n=1 Tax=Gryllotalpicola ginsengisoli TaxID=444608 RepID=UPI00048901F8|nr:YraN family protein [Gryllotalpicola ginsengisoli]